MIKPKYRRNTDVGQRWYTCEICGTDNVNVDLMFVSGSTEPSIGDVLTGNTSGHYGTVVTVRLHSGSWAGGDAEGLIDLSNPSGLRSQTADTTPFTMFTLSEQINNTTTVTSNVMSCHDTFLGAGKQYGRFHPEGDVIKYRGKTWCRWHFNYRFEREWREDERIDIQEDYREWI